MPSTYNVDLMILPEAVLQNRRLQTLVENQTTYTLEQAEMHVFETHEIAHKVQLRFDHLVLTNMLTGKKVMHLQHMNPFNFLPGESVILPSGEAICIDFPEAQMDNPTKCLALTISDEIIKDTVACLNESHAKIDQEWKFTDRNFHFTNDIAIQQILQRLLFLFTENHDYKEMFADFMLRELITRIMQTETKTIYTDRSLQLSANHRLAFILQYIQNNLHNQLTIKELSAKVYMSESNFHRVFKNELNISPIEFINEERIKLATRLLQDPRKRIKDIYMECGFNNISYFNRTFKKKENITPSEYQQKYAAQII